jgi:hypothetical protein
MAAGLRDRYLCFSGQHFILLSAVSGIPSLVVSR